MATHPNSRQELDSDKGKLAPRPKPRMDLSPDRHTHSKPPEISSGNNAAPQTNGAEISSDVHPHRSSPLPKPRVKFPSLEETVHSKVPKSRLESPSDDHTHSASKKLPLIPGRNGDTRPPQSSPDHKKYSEYERDISPKSVSPPAGIKNFLDQSETVAERHIVEVGCDTEPKTLEKDTEGTVERQESSSEESVEVSYTEPHFVHLDILMTSNIAYNETITATLNHSAENPDLLPTTADTVCLPPVHSYDEPNTFWT